MALSPYPGASFTDYAAIVRFNVSGYIDARNGGVYMAETQLSYSAGITYSFKIAVDTTTRTYDIYVTPRGADQFVIARGYAFRSEQSDASHLDYFGILSDQGGSQLVCGLSVTGGDSSSSVSTSSSSSPAPSSASSASSLSSSSSSSSLPPPGYCTSVSRYGITWTFASRVPCGQFVNGDWWVVGPVRVQSVSPAPTGSGASFRNGSELNPTISALNQGYDGRDLGWFLIYDATRSVVFPKDLKAGDALVSTKSNPEAFGCTVNANYDRYGWLSTVGDTSAASCIDVPINTAVVLTVLGSAPAPNSFRPAYVGGAPRTLFNFDYVHTELLPSINPPTGTSLRSLAELESSYARPWIDQIGHDTAQGGIVPTNNVPVQYGADRANYSNEAALTLMFNNHTPAEKRTLLIEFLQHGIDLFGYYQAGRDWYGNGGHHLGRKLPILFAGRLLQNVEMLAAGGYNEPGRFQEDDVFFLTPDNPPPFLYSSGSPTG